MIGKKFYKLETDKPIVSGSGVNVIYFTNKCNLACTYCYEDLPGRPPQIMTQEDIKNTIDTVIAREDPNTQTLFVLFGGEATLEWENVCFAMSYAYGKKTNVRFNLNTNGIKFLSNNFLTDVQNNYFYKTGILSIDVSFDGVGNGDRIFKDGTPSTPSMLKILRTLVESNFRYRLRYTLHSKNIKHAFEDIKRIIDLFHPERVITSVAWDTLTKEHEVYLLEFKEKFRDDWINKRVTTPVCELFCDMCDGCGARKEYKVYFSDEGLVTQLKNAESSPKFKDFKEKNSEEI